MENNQFENQATPEEVTAESVQPAPETENKVKDTAKMLLDNAKEQLNSLPEPVKNVFKKIKSLPKMVWAIIGAAIVAIIAAVVIISALSNTSSTPVSLMEKADNAKTWSASMKYQIYGQLNGFTEDEVKTIIDIMKKSESYDEEELKDEFEESLEEMKDEYGKDFKYDYKVIEKEKLDKDDLKDFKKTLRDYGKNMRKLEDEIEDYDSDDWEDMADALEISKSDAKKLAKTIIAIGKVWKGVDVTAGYELTVTVTLTGSELDEPEESEITVTVYKVNGRWVSESALRTVYFMAGSFGG